MHSRSPFEYTTGCEGEMAPVFDRAERWCRTRHRPCKRRYPGLSHDGRVNKTPDLGAPEFSTPPPSLREEWKHLIDSMSDEVLLFLQEALQRWTLERSAAARLITRLSKGGDFELQGGRPYGKRDNLYARCVGRPQCLRIRTESPFTRGYSGITLIMG